MRAWTQADEEAHLAECEDVLELFSYSEAEPRRVCGCGERLRHTPEAVARAELERDCPKVYL